MSSTCCELEANIWATREHQADTADGILYCLQDLVDLARSGRLCACRPRSHHLTPPKETVQ